MVTGPEIRDARRRAGLSQKELADRVGVVTRTIGGWERGENTPGMNEPKLLAVLRDYLVDAEPAPLRSVSDVELLAEVARRLARSERRERGDGDVYRDAASMTRQRGPEPSVEEVLAARERHLRAVAEEGDQADADQVDDLARRDREHHESQQSRDE